MTTATAALDPGEVIASAMRELYDQLREIVDRGPTDDPGLLDEIGNLTGRIRRRITRARKKAQPAENEPQTSVAPPAATQPAEGTGTGMAKTTTQVPDTTGKQPAPDAPSDATAAADAPTVPRHRAVSVTLPARRAGEGRQICRPVGPLSVPEVTVRLSRTGGRHRQATPRLPLWVYALVILLTVAGVTLGSVVSPSAFAALPATAVLLGAAHRLNARRQAPMLGGVR